MSVQVVPLGLAAMPPGPELAAVLAGIDPARVANGQIIDVLKASARQRSYSEALMFAVIADVGSRDPFADRDEVGYVAPSARYAADELRPALTWTRRKSEYELDFALVLTRVLPWVHEALSSARIDLPKARIFCTYLADLDANRAEAICHDLLPEAEGWTTSKLADRLRRLVIGKDPKRAEDLYRQAVEKGAVIGYLDDNGTATLTAHGLAPEDMAACFTNITTLAKAIKRAGHPAKLDQLRVRLLCGLTDSTLHMLTRDQIVTHFLRTAPQARDRGERPEPDQCRGPSDRHDDHPHSDQSTPTAADGPAPTGTAGRAPGVEVRVELGTLLGRTNHPGELAAWGPVLAGNARRTALSQRGGQWCFAVCDEGGYLLVPGITRYRPDCATNTRRGGAVELQLSATLLAKLTANPPKGWEKVIADIAAQYREWPATRKLFDNRPDDRFPNTGLRRHNRARDRNCRGPGCRQTASRCEFDHTIDHQYGGPTTDNNGGQFCPHCHALKTKGGWTFTQPEPGVFIGRSPLGQTYQSRGDPVVIPSLHESNDADPPF